MHVAQNSGHEMIGCYYRHSWLENGRRCEDQMDMLTTPPHLQNWPAQEQAEDKFSSEHGQCLQ